MAEQRADGMTPERWEWLQTLLISALELEEEEREEYLTVSCERDPALRAEVELLIAGHEAAGPLDRPADDLVQPLATAISAADDLSGTTVAQYEVESRLGGGGMGVVYRARDTKLGRTVALKFLPPHLGAGGAGRERFLVEAQAAARLDHPNICTILEIGETEDGRLFIAMPFYERGTLKKRLARQGALPVAEAVSVAAQVARGLAAVHERGVVHRDIKPANLVLAGEDTVKIVDFGIAKLADVSLTQPGQTPGTAAYMSPEQTSGGDVDQRTDLWSLGVVLYEMLAGRRPFASERRGPLIHAIQDEEPPPLRSLRPEVPPGLERIVMDLLAKEPEKRLPTADRLVEDLEAVASGTPLTRSPRFRTRGWPRSPLGRAAALALTLAGLGGLYGIVQSRVPELPSSDAQAEEARPAIAVLPFADMSPNRDQEYFSDGISYELINLLAKVAGLRVAAQTSSFSFKEQNLEITEIADRLNVAHVLEGSIRRADNRVRITAQLVRAEDGFPVWSEDWDRTMDDIFSIQDEIAADVAEQLQVALLGPAPTVEETDPAAYALLLQARQLGRERTSQSVEQSNALYQEALEIDPEYAAAWVGLASNYAYQGGGTGRLPIDEGFRLAREAANQALAIYPEYAPVHAVLGGMAVTYDRDLAAAARYVGRALELDPTNLDIIRSAGRLLRYLGRLDESVAVQKYVVARDPVNPNAHAALAFSYYTIGQFDEVIASHQTALTLSPERALTRSFIGMALLLKGEPEAALEAIGEEPNEIHRLIVLSMAYHALGEAAESDAALAELIAKYEREAAFNIAYVLAFRGEADRAFEWLGNAVLYRDSGVLVAPVQHLFANIHDDPRWILFLESIGMSPEQLAAIEFDMTLPK